jgi:hypothetical protein
MTEIINYSVPLNLFKIEGKNTSIEFTFNDSIPSTQMPFLGIDASIPFLNSREISGFQYVKIIRDDVIVFTPSYTNSKMTGLLADNGDYFQLTYKDEILFKIKEKRGNSFYAYYLMYDDEGKVFEINNYSGEEGAESLISQKELQYSDNDILLGFNELNENHMFKFNDFDIQEFSSIEGIFTIIYQ